MCAIPEDDRGARQRVPFRLGAFSASYLEADGGWLATIAFYVGEEL